MTIFIENEAEYLLSAVDEPVSSRVSWPPRFPGWPTAGALLRPFITGHLRELPVRRWIGAIRFLALDCPDELRRARLSARPAWRSRDIDEQVEFGRWLRRNIPDRVDTSGGTPEDTATEITTWIDRHLAGTEGIPAG